MEQDRVRLSKFKNSKASRLKELEDQVKKFEVLDNVDTEKLIQALDKKAKEVDSLRSIADNYNSKLDAEMYRNEEKVRQMKLNFLKEQQKNQQIVDKME